MRDLDNLDELLSKLDITPDDIVRSLHEYRNTRFDNLLSDLVDNRERDNEATSGQELPSDQD
jgi:hypothetical protein